MCFDEVITQLAEAETALLWLFTGIVPDSGFQYNVTSFFLRYLHPLHFIRIKLGLLSLNPYYKCRHTMRISQTETGSAINKAIQFRIWKHGKSLENLQR